MPLPTRHFDRLRGKTAIVTGAGCVDDSGHVGIGAAISTMFAAEGARVCVVDVDTARGERTRQRIEAAGGEAIFVAADITAAAQCRNAVDAAVSAFGDVQVLVNNVGSSGGAAKLDAVSDERWRFLLDLNLTSAFVMTKSAIPALIAKPGAAIINIASVAGIRAMGSIAYGAAKAGLIAFTHEVALTYGRVGLRANVIAPGHLYTPFISDRVDAAARALRKDLSPLGLEGDSWDVGAAAVFFASDEARYITSVCLPVDGGVTEMAPLAALAMLGR